MTAEASEGPAAAPPPHDPYRPPAAEPAGVDPAREPEGEPPPFFPVSPLKLAVMSVATFQLYHLFWFYRHWRHVNGWETHKVMPAVRAFFSVIFAASLFRRVPELASYREATIPATSPGVLTLAYLLGILAWRLPGLACLAGLLQVLPLMVFQSRVNALHAALGHDPHANARFTVANVLGMLLGGALWLLFGAISLLPAEV